LGSYAVEVESRWNLRPEDAPTQRRADLEAAIQSLTSIGGKLGFSVTRSDREKRMILWHRNKESVYVFTLVASAIAGQVIRQNPYPPERCLLVLPGGRAGLLSAKLRRDPVLEQTWNRGWRVLKFRQLRQLAATEELDLARWEKELSGDPLEPPEQLRMF
jgi:hypothetical protein